jgi:hypothetical protein
MSNARRILGGSGVGHLVLRMSVRDMDFGRPHTNVCDRATPV